MIFARVFLRYMGPIYSKGAARTAAKANARLRLFGIESIGRQDGSMVQSRARVSANKLEAAIGVGGDLGA